eukprot:1150357-Pelagomonas_calceolata.AAC.1
MLFARGEAFALLESRPVSMHGLWIIVAKVGTCYGSKFTTEMWIGSGRNNTDEFGLQEKPSVKMHDC